MSGIEYIDYAKPNAVILGTVRKRLKQLRNELIDKAIEIS